MATINLYLDTRRAESDGNFRVRLVICHHRQRTYITTAVSVGRDQWVGGRVVGHPQARIFNAHLQNLLVGAKARMLELATAGRLERMMAVDIKNAVSGAPAPADEPDGPTFLSHYESFMERHHGRTRELYAVTLKRLYEFRDLDGLTFEDVTTDWLEDFDAFLSQTSPSPNARAIHMRNIRAVFNDALDREVTHVYPFRRFKIKKQATVKRSLTVEQLRTLFDYPVEPYQRRWLDLFKLSFYLIGINFVDLYHLDKIQDGRVNYYRAKTAKLYSIRVEPEGQALIEQYRGTSHLLWVADDYRKHTDAMHRMNDALKRIGPVTRSGRGGTKHIDALFPDISSYWARHTWATIAASLDIPKETISAALGHEIGSAITSIYIDFDREKVDEANRRVLDWVLYGRK